MKSLKNLEMLTKSIASDPNIINKLRSVMPVYEFTVLASEYNEITKLLLSSRENISIEKVFANGGVYIPGAKADWNTLSKLTTAGIYVADIQEDKELLAVYARLAVLAKTLAETTDKAANNLRIKSELIHGLLTNTSAFNQLINASIQYSADSTATVSNTKAIYTIDISANTGIPATDLLTKVARKVEKQGVNIVADKILSDTHNVVVSELANKFLNSAIREFQGKVSGNDIVTEFNSFGTRKNSIISDKFSDSAKAARKAALSMDSIISKYKPEKTTIFEEDIKEEAQDTSKEETKSAANLKSILNSLLAKAIEARMAPSNVSTNRRYLRYRTGTFAESAHVEYVEPSATGKLMNIGYTYKNKPYKGLYTRTGKYAGTGIGLFFSARGRDVQYLIQSAIQDIAKNLITKKLNIKPI